MYIKKKSLVIQSALFLLLFCVFFSTSLLAQDLPNILWLTSEDNSPFAGCYGDELATTPNMDKLAREGFLYTHAYANAPVCAPARNTIITGIYANSGGNQHMRSNYLKSNLIKMLPELLREAGYYCTNNSKEDYNIDKNQTKGIWDESSNKAHYKNRPDDKPFFAVFNSNISHESSIHKSIPSNQLRHDPSKVKLPPYHPDTPEIRHDWAQYYDKIEDMDQWLGAKLQELEESGLAENTIVFYFGDHGGVLGRSKRYVYESGTRVPLIVRIPKKYQKLFPADNVGDQVGRLVSFVDLAPTMMSLVGRDIPGWMQGKAFLGDQKTLDPENAFMFRGRMDERYDMSRAVRSKRFRYIMNYMPHRVYGQHLNYLWKAPSMQSWERAFLAGQCNEMQSTFWNKKPVEELYDTENDPWEVNNLADDPQYAKVLMEMRKAAVDWSLGIGDTGFIPEAERSIRSPEASYYDYMRTVPEKWKDWIEAAQLAAHGSEDNIELLMDLLKSDDAVLRYWGAVGMLISDQQAKPKVKKILGLLPDNSDEVTAVLSECLYNCGYKEEGLKYLKKVVNSPYLFARVQALNSIDIQGVPRVMIEEEINEMKEKYKHEKENRYDLRVVEWLEEKWGRSY
ncbi:sulfatase family protein [Echinicola shivajiensis]|uniref:sulfatase family protein n=1 Tax=Echinicola shivajiensis TaxID=1035916 RepID=UPI001BFC5871|nr:sulfatase [Echinicola shivajiensis]